MEPPGRGHSAAVAAARAVHTQRDGITNAGWRIRTVKGPIVNDRDVDGYRQQLGGDVLTLPEMLFDHNLVELRHEASGVALVFDALDALRAWKQENLPPLQVKVAEEWRKAREHEIQAQKAIQLEYDWTYTTPYAGTVTRGDAATPGPESASADGAGAAASPPADAPTWVETSEQIDRALLMERDPILFYDEVMLYESDLDDNGVSQLSVKLRVMPRCWLVLLRFWLRVDGCMARLREVRLFCRHDQPHLPTQVLREVKHCEVSFRDPRARGAPPEGPAYADADAASQAFQAVAPVGMTLLQVEKLVLPQG